MKMLKNSFSICFIVVLGFVSLFLNSCSNKSMEGMVIFSQVPSDNFDFNKINIISKYEGAKIVAINPDQPNADEIVLTTDFYSACSPNISYDAKRMLFSAQQNKNDSWQIWEMDLSKRSSKKITDFDQSCYGPVYLPANRMAFSKQMPETGTGLVYALYTMNLNGTNISQITFQPHSDYISTVLNDGRILMLTKELFPQSGETMYMAMRPNGTKAELFYKGQKGSVLNNQTYETKDGLVYFIEYDNGNPSSGNIVSVHQNRPLFTKVNLTSEIGGSFYSVLPMQTGEMIVSCKPSSTGTIGLYRFSAKEKSVGEQIYNPSEYHIVEPVLVKPFVRPRDLPDDVNPEIATGQFLFRNINATEQISDKEPPDNKATKVEILGIQRSLGIVNAEEDGSIYLKIVADTPIRFQALDDNNNVVFGPSGWIWIRPFERRGWVGFGQYPELAPDNRVPLAVKKPPVSVPVENHQVTGQSSTNTRTE